MIRPLSSTHRIEECLQKRNLDDLIKVPLSGTGLAEAGFYKAMKNRLEGNKMGAKMAPLREARVI